jgi:hypothetical protein
MFFLGSETGLSESAIPVIGAKRISLILGLVDSNVA